MVYFNTETLNKNTIFAHPRNHQETTQTLSNSFIVHSYQTLSIQIHGSVIKAIGRKAGLCVKAERWSCFAVKELYMGFSQSPKGPCIRFQSITAWKICSNDSPGQGCVHCAAGLHGFVEIIVSEGRRKGLGTEWGLCQAKLLIVLNQFQRRKQQVMDK